MIQGSAADYIKMAMKGIMEELCAKGLADQCCCCLQIHDELVFEIVPRHAAWHVAASIKSFCG